MADDIRYVSKVGKDGWLRVHLEDGADQSLPQFLKVRVTHVDSGREHFEILEGIHKGKKGNVSRPKPNEGSFFIKGSFHKPAATVKFDRAKQMLWFGGRGPFNAFTGGFKNSCPGHTPVAAGLYWLQIPFAPSNKTRPGYYAYTDYHKTWFRLGLDPHGDQFLHVGEISHGCVTVRAFIPDFNGSMPEGFQDLRGADQSLEKGCIGLPMTSTPAPVVSWTAIYNYLIAARANDSSVGKITVV
jgi:hypothetical protein